MAIEIGSLVVRGSFGQPRQRDDGLTETQMQAKLDQLRRELHDALGRQIAASEQRIKEGLF
jgi:hypothetical protein